MMVTLAPLSLRMVMALLAVEIGAYVPSLTSISSPALAALTAFWMVRFAVVHDNPLAVSFPVVLT